MEAIIDRGTYRYFVNGATVDVVEPWTITRRTDGTIVTRSQRLARAYGTTISVETTAEGEGAPISAFQVDWASTGAVPAATARYTLADGKLWASCQINQEPPAEIEISVDASAILAPLMRVHMGPTLRHVAALGSATVIVPDIRNHADALQLLRPLLETRSARLLSHESIHLHGVEVAATRYRYLAGQYDDSAVFWVNDRGHMCRYVWRDWRVDLDIDMSISMPSTSSTSSTSSAVVPA